LSSGKTGRRKSVLYAILCYDSKDVVGAWTREEDDAAMAWLAVVRSATETMRIPTEDGKRILHAEI
jgi:hypothetical protein